MSLEQTKLLNRLAATIQRETLQILGFRRTGRTFSKPVNDVVWHVAITKRQDITTGPTSFEIDLSVTSEQFDKVVRNIESNWTVGPMRVDLLRLVYGPMCLDKEWVMESEEDVSVAANVFAQFFAQHGLPWLSKYKNTSAIVDKVADQDWTVFAGPGWGKKAAEKWRKWEAEQPS